jgi:acetylornithine deacetylase/succinyl-diaminopimelate desuccinylase-like protein
VEGLHHGSSDAPDVPEERFRSDAGVLPGVGLLGTGTVPERTWHRPAATVLALEAPGVDEAANVLLPRARAVVSVRLAPGDDGRRAMQRLTAHLQEHAPWGVQVDVVPGAVGEPFALEAVGPVYDVARQAFGEAYGNAAVEGGIGGSIPFIAELARAFPGATVLVTGVGDPASRWHGVDESLHLGMWATACRAEALLLARLA